MKRRIGYVAINRSLQDNFLWTAEPFTKGQAWIDLIMYANWKDTKEMDRGEVLEIKRGQFYSSDGFWVDRWKWSRNKVRNFFLILEKEKMIIRKSGRRRTVITIVNYNSYQGPNKDEGINEGTTESAIEGKAESIEEGTQHNKEKNDNKIIIDNKNINNKEQYTSGKAPFDIYDFWMISTFGEGKFDAAAKDKLIELVQKYGEELVRDALEKTIGKHGTTIAYTEKILSNNAQYLT